MTRKPTEYLQLTLRLREELRARLEKAAAKSEQSLNSEILMRLEASFERERIKQIIEATVESTIQKMHSMGGE